MSYHIRTILLVSLNYLITILSLSYHTLPHSSLSEEKWPVILEQSYYYLRTILLHSYHHLILLFHTPLCQYRDCLIAILKLSYNFLITLSSQSYFALLHFCQRKNETSSSKKLISVLLSSSTILSMPEEKSYHLRTILLLS